MKELDIIAQLRKESDELLDGLTVNLRALEEQLAITRYRTYAEVFVMPGWNLAHIPGKGNKTIRLWLIPTGEGASEQDRKMLYAAPVVMRVAAVKKLPLLFEQIQFNESTNTADLMQAKYTSDHVLNAMIVHNQKAASERDGE